MTERRVVGVPDDEEEIELSVIYTDSADVMSFAKGIAPKPEADRFNMSLEDLRKMDGLSPAMKGKLTRTITKRMSGAGAGSKSTTHEQSNGVYGAMDIVTPIYNLEYLAKLYEVNPTHHAAVDAKVANIISLGYHWEETQETRERIAAAKATGNPDTLDRLRRKMSRVKSELDEWLESRNEEDTWIEILEKVYTDREVMGTGYLEIGRDRSGKIGYLGHIPAHTIRARRERDGYVQIVGQKLIYFRNFQATNRNPVGSDSRPNEILAFKKYSPRTSYYGAPDIVSALNAVAGAEFASRFNLDYFEHKAAPRYMIVVKGAKLSPENERRLVSFFQTSLKGENHRSIYVPLPKTGDVEPEIEIIPVEAKVQDASFVKYHEWNRGEILMAHRVPPSKIGLAGDTSIASAREADKMFKEQVTRPAQNNVESRLAPLFKEKTSLFEFKLNELTLTDEETRSKIHEKYLRWKVLDINEVREVLGYEGKEDGDQPADISSQGAAEQRSQARSGRAREQRQDDGPNNSGGAVRQPNGAGERDRG